MQLARIKNGQSKHTGKATKLEYDGKKIAEHWGTSVPVISAMRSAMRQSPPKSVHQLELKAAQGRKSESDKCK